MVEWLHVIEALPLLQSRGVVHGAWGGVLRAAKGVTCSIGHVGKSTIGGAQAVLSFASQALQRRPQQQHLSEV